MTLLFTWYMTLANISCRVNGLKSPCLVSDVAWCLFCKCVVYLELMNDEQQNKEQNWVYLDEPQVEKISNSTLYHIYSYLIFCLLFTGTFYPQSQSAVARTMSSSQRNFSLKGTKWKWASTDETGKEGKTAADNCAVYPYPEQPDPATLTTSQHKPHTKTRFDPSTHQSSFNNLACCKILVDLAVCFTGKSVSSKVYI